MVDKPQDPCITELCYSMLHSRRTFTHLGGNLLLRHVGEALVILVFTDDAKYYCLR